jgi:hypothetical protein
MHKPKPIMTHLAQIYDRKCNDVIYDLCIACILMKAASATTADCYPQPPGLKSGTVQTLEILPTLRARLSLVRIRKSLQPLKIPALGCVADYENKQNTQRTGQCPTPDNGQVDTHRCGTQVWDTHRSVNWPVLMCGTSATTLICSQVWDKCHHTNLFTGEASAITLISKNYDYETK